jgi:hypothetical protein
MRDGGYTRTEAWNLQLQGRLTAAEAAIERLREAARESIGMIDNCAGAPTNPDSLPQMVRERLAREINGGKS